MQLTKEDFPVRCKTTIITEAKKTTVDRQLKISNKGGLYFNK